MPLLALYFDGHSDMRVDFRLTRESFNALMAVLGTDCDHGWGPEISCHLQAEDVIAQDPKGEPEGQLQCYHRPIVGKGDKLSGGLSTHRTFVCLFVCSFIVYNDVLKCFFYN